MFLQPSNFSQSDNNLDNTPKSHLGYHTNNKYPEFPPLMSDGRSVIASWQPEATMNSNLIQTNNIQTNWQYRRYLMDNAKQIMEFNFNEAANDVGYYKRPIDLPSVQSNIVDGVTTSPHLYSSAHDNSQPKGYSTSDLKELYLSKEQLAARKIAPSMNY